MTKKSILIITNILTLLALIFFAIRENYPERLFKKMEKDAPVDYRDNWRYTQETSLYDHYQKKGNVVMLGNSITYQCDWNELLDRSDVINRGVVKDITAGYLSRMNYVIEVEPKICFVMGGANDIVLGVETGETVDNLERIIDTLSKYGIEPVMQSVLYADKDYKPGGDFNQKVAEINTLLKEICREKKVVYFDVNELLATDGFLNKQYSFDGIHLTGKGYEVWGSALQEIIEDRLKSVDSLGF